MSYFSISLNRLDDFLRVFMKQIRNCIMKLFIMHKMIILMFTNLKFQYPALLILDIF